MNTLRRFAIGLVAVSILLGTRAQAQVLQQLPSDAMVVIKIKSLQQLNEKIAFFAQDWGLVEAQPEMKDPLGYALGLGGMGAGLDRAGDAAVAVMMPAQEQQEPNMLALVPVTDFKAFAATLPNAKPEGDVTAFTPGRRGKTFYAVARGKYAAISDSKDLLARPGQGITPPPAAAKELASKDIAAFVSLKAIRPRVLPEFQKTREMLIKQIEQAMQNAPGADAKFAPVLRAYLTQLMAVAEGLIKDGDAVTLGINLSKEGIASSMVTEFNPDSYMGKALAKMKNTDASFTAGLPEGNYLLYGGMAVDPQGVQVLMDFVQPIEAEFKKLGDEGKPMAAYFDATRRWMAAARYSNFGVMTPGVAQMGKSGLLQSITIMGGDSGTMMEAQKAAMAQQQEMMKMAGVGSMGIKITSTPNDKTVDGVQFDKAVMTIDPKAAQNPEAQMVGFIVRMLFGPNGMVAYTGSVDKQKMISVTGGGDELLASAVSAAKTNADPLGKGPAAPVQAALPQNRLMAMYVPVDEIARTVLDFAATRGLPAGVKVEKGLPPLGMTIASEGSALRMDGYAPEKTIKAMISAGMQVYLMQMPGDKPGGPARP